MCDCLIFRTLPVAGRVDVGGGVQNVRREDAVALMGERAGMAIGAEASVATVLLQGLLGRATAIRAP